jgi:hypothetical protein
MKFKFSSVVSRIASAIQRPVGRVGLAIMTVVLATAPGVLFFHPADFPPRRQHVDRDPLKIYLLYSDDIAYVSASRTFSSTVSNLFVPHNTHVVPAWRLLTWALVVSAGSLGRLPQVLAVATYSILVAVMLLTGRLVARETGRMALGYFAMVVVGTTSLILVPATWYSAGQPLWAGFGVLAVLWFAQSYRRTGRWQALLLAAITVPLAGWLWTAGHVAGPVATVYLWFDGRRRNRFAAAALLAVTLLAVAFTLMIAGKQINQTVSFHGRTPTEAARPTQGLFHTAQAIAENLAFGNLGLTVHTTPTQGALLTGCVVLLWTSRWWLRLIHTPRAADHAAGSAQPERDLPRFRPLECAGAALVLSSYLIVWTFRGREDYEFLRTINLRVFVPWYDAMPQIGMVLFVTGWWDATRPNMARRPRRANAKPLTWLGSVGVCILAAALIALNRPRVDLLVRATVPRMVPSEQRLFRIPRLQTMRANALLIDEAERQHAYLRRMDQWEAQARLLGLSRSAIRAAFGHRWLPGAHPPLVPSMYDEYDAEALLDLPDKGRDIDPASLRARLGTFFVEEKQPRPLWILPGETWPPPTTAPAPN